MGIEKKITQAIEELKKERPLKTALRFPERMPRCFTSKAFWEDWKFLARWTLDARVDKPTYCIDCTPSCQLDMKRVGRCEHPETVFIKEVHKDDTVTWKGIRK